MTRPLELSGVDGLLEPEECEIRATVRRLADERLRRGSDITPGYPVLRHADNLESVLTYEAISEMHSLGQALTGLPAVRE